MMQRLKYGSRIRLIAGRRPARIPGHPGSRILYKLLLHWVM